MSLQYSDGDSQWDILRKLLINLFGNASTGDSGAAFGGTANAAQVSQPAIVTVGGNDVLLLAGNGNRAFFIIRNAGAQSAQITLGNAATANGLTLLAGGILDSSDWPLYYGGPVRARWNGVSTTFEILEVNKP